MYNEDWHSFVTFKTSMPITEYSLTLLDLPPLISLCLRMLGSNPGLLRHDTTLTVVSELSEPGARAEQEAGVGAAPSPLTHVWVGSPQESAHRRPAPTLLLL
jgi:hypothetical protein